MQVGIIDYGSGNVGSVFNAILRLGHNAILSSDVEELSLCTHVILPGVGSFSSAKRKLDSVISDQDLRVLAKNSQGFLGICVGMQLLCESGSENEVTPGYGFFSGEVGRIPSASVLPHMGWNNLVGMEMASPLLKGISPVDDFYFVHSYSLVGGKGSQIIASAEYGSVFPAVVGDNNVFGVQFHPEKSSTAGSKLLTNFLSI